MIIRQVKEEGKQLVAELALLLWSNHTLESLTEEMSSYICGDKSAIFIAVENDEAIGFAQCGLRSDYVEGTSTSPVGYLEGVFIKKQHRYKGIGKALVLKCENWALEKGCTEFASDCELDNTKSLKFHLKSGFNEANRIICFTKKLEVK